MIGSIVAVSILLIIVGIYIPVDNEQQTQPLPWQINTTPQGSTQVFGLILGETVLQQAEQKLNGVAEISLFVSPIGHYVVEAYFDKISSAGLSARMIMVIDSPQSQLEAMYQRGTRISTLGSGGNKVTLNAPDVALLRNLPIISITYLPHTRLDETMIVKRFGQASQKITEQDNDMVHWLYPELGLDIALNSDGKAVLQYTSPDRFSELKAPLTQRP